MLSSRVYMRMRHSPKVTVGYTRAKKLMHGEDFSDKCRGEGIYSGVQDRVVTSTLEHVVPQSTFMYKEPMKSDMHHLYPCIRRLNSHRNNYMFCDINDKQSQWLDKYGNKISTRDALPSSANREDVNEKDNKRRWFEPRNPSKGNIARAIAYFYLIYPEYQHTMHGVINPAMLFAWNAMDPVDEAEIARNKFIASIQGNENPFILHPTLVQKLFGA